MKIKLIALLKRKPGMTKQEFTEYYETRHAPLIAKLLGSCVIEYRRDYIDYDHPLSYIGTYTDHNKPAEAPFDVVTTQAFANQQEFDRMFELLTQPETASAIAKDETRFLDCACSHIVIVHESHDTAIVSQPGQLVGCPSETVKARTAGEEVKRT